MERTPPHGCAGNIKKYDQQKSRADQLIEAMKVLNSGKGQFHAEVKELYTELGKELGIGNDKDRDGDDLIVLKHYSKKELADELVSRSFASTLCQLGVDGKMEYSVDNGKDGCQDTISGPARVIVLWKE